MEVGWKSSGSSGCQINRSQLESSTHLPNDKEHQALLMKSIQSNTMENQILITTVEAFYDRGSPFNFRRLLT